MRDDRPAQVRLLRHARGNAVAPAAAAAPADVALVERRAIDQADQRLVAVDQRDQRREQRDAAREADRPVDRIDDPARSRRGRLPRRTPRRRSRTPERPRADGARITRSAARSASVTGEPSDLDSTATARKRGRISRRARSAAWPAARAAASRSSERIGGRVESSPRSPATTREEAWARRSPSGSASRQTSASRSCTATTSACATPRTRARSRRCNAGPRPAAA